MTNIVLRKANKFVDVFFGNQGWHEREWSRFVTSTTDNIVALKRIKGAHVDSATYAYVKRMVQDLV